MFYNEDGDSMNYLKKIKKDALLTDLIYMVIGLLFILIPDFISNFICYLIGILIIVLGVKPIHKYLKLIEKTRLSKMIFVVGIIMILIGFFIMLNPEKLASILPITIGLYLIVIALAKFSDSVEYKKLNYDKWYNFLLSSILTLIIGLVIVFNPFKTVTLAIRIVGIVLLIDGFFDIYNLYSYQETFNDFKKDMKKIFK